ncbi:YtrH family sporulation protein [Alkalihalobacillus sp. AL-G]|uniref:YtrH family sporulation protein n=1 Tax=Alkalihalobacillus sp. AL-G TaxID=2926399 RepID=UPI002729BCCA|nr:YtrH family sporulation protein [Alkalihalobacillus sp. AL-G]WLD92357.1 YtrH family sporulation protein [Alkalihalobacillus sp. AL-G]
MVEREFVTTNIIYFFVAFGIIMGGCVIGAIGMMLTGKPPFLSMHQLSKSLKIWAIVAAIGGTFDTINHFERNFLGGGSFVEVINQIIYIIAALLGANTGEAVIQWITQEE